MLWKGLMVDSFWRMGSYLKKEELIPEKGIKLQKERLTGKIGQISQKKKSMYIGQKAQVEKGYQMEEWTYFWRESVMVEVLDK